MAQIREVNNMSMTIVWCSRHKMTAEQKADLLRRVRVSDCDVATHNITWAATADEDADTKQNRKTWDSLYAVAGANGIIAGVFPPVALEALRDVGREDVCIASPVSRQAPELRVGDVSIPFAHVRWAFLK